MVALPGLSSCLFFRTTALFLQAAYALATASAEADCPRYENGSIVYRIIIIIIIILIIIIALMKYRGDIL